jgi:transposase
VKGIKRHAGVDILGLPQVIHITTANVNDREAALEMFRLHSDSLPAVEMVLADGGYTGEKFATGVREVLSAQVEIVKRSELHTFVVMPKRWVVERSFAWLDKCRRLWKNCERQLNTSLQMVVLAFLSLLLKRF